MRLDPLAPIMRFESGGRNVRTQAWNPTTGFNQSTGTVTGPSTASGYFQITNTTWRGIAPSAGINLAQYPTAMSAPMDVQRSAATALYNRGGFRDWAPYNADLRRHIAAQGGESAFIQPGQLRNDPGFSSGIGGTNADVNNPYGFSQLKTTPYSDGTGEITTENGTFSNFSQSAEPKGDIDSLLKSWSKTVQEAIDRASKTANKTAEGEGEKNRALDSSQFQSTVGTFQDYFIRAMFVIVGLVAFGAGLYMFGRPAQKMIVQNVKKFA